MSKLKLHLLLIFLCSMSYTFAQYPTKSFDFSHVNEREIDMQQLRDVVIREHQYLDSIYQARKADSLELLYRHLITSTSSYNSFTLSSEYVSTEYNGLAEELAVNGFDPMPENLFSWGYGFTFKRNRFLHEYMLNIFIGRTSSLNDQTVKVTGGNLLNYTFGYDILNQRRFQFYPFLGISQQFTEIEVTNESDATASTDGLFNLAQETNEFSVTSDSWKIAAGFEFDYHLKYSARTSGIIIGYRYGITSTFAEGKYKTNGTTLDYDPDVQLRHWYSAIVVKIYGRSMKRVDR